MSLAVLPLAITMNAGPQIMSALIFVTASKPLKLSAYFMAGVVIAVTVGVTITFTLASVLGGSISLGDPSDSGSVGNIIQYVLVGLLIFLSIRSYPTRATSEPPRWLGAMQNAKPRTAFMAGLLLSIFPSGRPGGGRRRLRSADGSALRGRHLQEQGGPPGILGSRSEGASRAPGGHHR